MLGLKPYSTELLNRLTARHTLSARIVREASGPSKQRILDVGCSTGWLEYLMRAEDNLSFDGIDVDESALVEAARNAAAAHFKRASALDLPFEDARFDGAVMFEVIEHVPKGTELRALSEVRRTLKPGAWFVLSTPFAHPVATALDPAWYAGHRHYARPALERLLASTGFRIDWTTTRGGAWEIGGMFALYACKWILRSEAPGHDTIERGREREFLDGREGFTHIFLRATAV